MTLYKLKDFQPSISFASPSGWNDLSELVKSIESITIFKRRLNTELFSRYVFSR